MQTDHLLAQSYFKATQYKSPFYGDMLIIHHVDELITFEEMGDIAEEMYWFKIKKLFLIVNGELDDITDPDTGAFQDAISYLNQLYNT
jgi:hypothetical protein